MKHLHLSGEAGAQLGVRGGGGRGWEGERPPLPFFENQKKCPDSEKKGPDSVYP